MVNSSIEESLLTPPTVAGYRVAYEITEPLSLMASADVGFEEYTQLSRVIYNEHEKHKYDGFVVLHGTDTLCYTAAAVSFVITGLKCPVIFTGAMTPLCHAFSDGHENLMGALMLAGYSQIRGVSVFFDNILFDGRRVIKTHTNDRNSFKSSDGSFLCEFRSEDKLIPASNDWGDSITELRPNLSRNIILLQLFPGLTVPFLKKCLEEPVRGVVLQTHGAGHIPSSQAIYDTIEEATKRGVRIMNVTRCHHGSVNCDDSQVKLLSKMGVVCGGNITTEVAFMTLASECS